MTRAGVFLDKLRRRLSGGGFLTSVALLAGGTAFAQAVTMLAAPVLTRIYSPGDYGLVAVYGSILGIVGVLSSLRYEVAIPLPPDDETAANVLALCLVLVFALTGVMLVVVPWAEDAVVRWTNAPGLRPFLWLVPVGFLLGGLYNALNYWALRKRAFGRITRTRVNQSLSGTGTNLTLGLLGLKPVGLLIGTMVSVSAGIGTLAALAWRQDRKAIKAIGPRAMVLGAVRYAKFPLIASWSAVLNTLAFALPMLLISRLFGTDVAGEVALVNRTLGLPLGLIGGAIAQVYFAEGAELAAKAPDRLYPLFMRTTKRLAVVAAIVAAVGLAAPLLFGPLFGPKWNDAGLYALLLTPVFVAQVFGNPLSMTAAIGERQGLQLFGDALRAGLVVGVFALGHQLGLKAPPVLGMYAGVMAVTYAVYWLVYAHIARHVGGAGGAPGGRSGERSLGR